MINIIFDFDGTLFDSSEGIYEAYRLSCDAINRSSINKSDFIHFIGPPISEIAKKLYPDLSTKSLDEFVCHFRYHYDKYLYLKSSPYQGVYILLDYLYRSEDFSTIGIVTNKPTAPTHKLLSKYNMLKFFNCVIGIDYLFVIQNGARFESKSKAINYFKSIFSANELPFVYIGDTYSDQIAAKISNCNFVSVNYGYNDWSSFDEKPLAIADSVEHLLYCLKNLSH